MKIPNTPEWIAIILYSDKILFSDELGKPAVCIQISKNHYNIFPGHVNQILYYNNYHITFVDNFRNIIHCGKSILKHINENA